MSEERISLAYSLRFQSRTVGKSGQDLKQLVTLAVRNKGEKLFMDTAQDPNLGNGAAHNGQMIPYRHTHRPT